MATVSSYADPAPWQELVDATKVTDEVPTISLDISAKAEVVAHSPYLAVRIINYGKAPFIFDGPHLEHEGLYSMSLIAITSTGRVLHPNPSLEGILDLPFRTGPPAADVTVVPGGVLTLRVDLPTSLPKAIRAAKLPRGTDLLFFWSFDVEGGTAFPATHRVYSGIATLPASTIAP